MAATAGRARPNQLTVDANSVSHEGLMPWAGASFVTLPGRRLATLQGYNARAVVTEHQVVVAAALTREANDLQQLAPMLAAVDQALAAAEIPDRPGMLLADSATGRSPT